MPKALAEARKKAEKTIRVEAGHGAAQIRADSVNAEQRTVDIIWAAGASVKRYSWEDGYYMEELSMEPAAIRLDRFAVGMSLLDSHMSGSMEARLGTVIADSVRIEGGKAYATVKLSRKPLAEEILQDLADGNPINISVGYRIHKYEKTEGDGETLPIMRALDWEPLELSVVPVPADPGATSRSNPKDGESYEVKVVQAETSERAPSAPQTEKTPMNKRDAAKTYNGDQLSALAIGVGHARNENETDEALRARLLAAFDAEDERARTDAEALAARNAADPSIQTRGSLSASTALVPSAGAQPPAVVVPVTAEDVQRAVQEGTVAERRRTAEIQALATQALIADAAFIDEHVRKGSTVDQFRSALLDKLVEQQGKVPTFPYSQQVRGGQDSRETARRLAANAMLHRHGLTEKLEEGANQYRHHSTMDLMKDFLEEYEGVRCRGMSPHDIVTRGLHTTSDFPVILGDITRQTLLNGYTRPQNTFQLFATKQILTDFRETKVLDMGAAPDLSLVNEHGEFTRGTVRESAEGMKLQSYGKIIGFTRQMIINDSLNAFARLISNWGQKVAKLEGDIVWGAIIANSKLKDGKGLYHADHGNLAASGTALDIANLTSARTAMRKQKDIDGEPVAINPKYLFTGSELEIAAQTLISGVFTPNQIANVVPEGIRSLVPVYEYRLDKITTKAWFLFADAASSDGRGIHYLHLQGQEQPRTDERVGFDVDGIEYKIGHDFGVGLTDSRFSYKNAGL